MFIENHANAFVIGMNLDIHINQRQEEEKEDFFFFFLLLWFYHCSNLPTYFPFHAAQMLSSMPAHNENLQLPTCICNCNMQLIDSIWRS